jgi:hypothetical protein
VLIGDCGCGRGCVQSRGRVQLPGTSITVSEEEQKIFDYLVDVVKASNINSELRVAGGWVRDKVNGLQYLPRSLAHLDTRQLTCARTLSFWPHELHPRQRGSNEKWTWTSLSTT